MKYWRLNNSKRKKLTYLLICDILKLYTSIEIFSMLIDTPEIYEEMLFLTVMHIEGRLKDLYNSTKTSKLLSNEFPWSSASWPEYRLSSIYIDSMLVPNSFRFFFWSCNDHDVVTVVFTPDLDIKCLVAKSIIADRVPQSSNQKAAHEVRNKQCYCND